MPSLCLPCSKKRCFVDLGWFCFAWLFPFGCIFFALPGFWDVLRPHRQKGTESLAFPPLANLSSLVLWTGFYWVFNTDVDIYKHNQQITEPCKQNFPLPFLESKAGREKLLLSGPRGVRVSVGHRSLAWQQPGCSLTGGNSVPALPYQAIQTQLAVGEIRG